MDVGQTAPDFKRTATDGTEVSLSGLNGEGKFVVLFFYPKDGTPTCTKEACLFRDTYAEYTADNAVIIGVSSDSDASHRAFATTHELPYHLISDPGSVLRRAFGVKNNYLFVPGRVTFVIDREGVIQSRYEAVGDAEGHVQQALATVKKLNRAG